MARTPKRVILSHPFSGAAYGWFEQFNPCPTIPKLQVPGHPYYKYLYGTDFLSWIDPSLTLLLLYEQVVLPPADAFLPDSDDVTRSPSYKNPHLGLESNWDLVHDVIGEYHERAEQDRNDAVLADMLHGMPDKSKEQIIVSCYLDVFLSEQLACPIVCGDQRKKLIQRLAEMAAVSLQKGEETFTEPTLAGDYVKISGLTFSASSVEELYDLKSDSKLRDYATGFLKAIHSPVATTENFPFELANAIESAIDSAALSKKVSGFLSGTSRAASYVGLVPVIGTAASVVGIAATHGTDAATRRAQRSEWYELAIHIAATRQRKELLMKVAELRTGGK